MQTSPALAMFALVFVNGYPLFFLYFGLWMPEKCGNPIGVAADNSTHIAYLLVTQMIFLYFHVFW